jgi:hypothetical protein
MLKYSKDKKDTIMTSTPSHNTYPTPEDKDPMAYFKRKQELEIELRDTTYPTDEEALSRTREHVQGLDIPRGTEYSALRAKLLASPIGLELFHQQLCRSHDIDTRLEAEGLTPPPPPAPETELPL